MQNTSVTRVMTPAPGAVDPLTSVAAAERLMRERKCHHVPVVEGGKVVGMLGRLDLLKALVLRSEGGEADAELLRRSPLKVRRVADVMQRNLKVLGESSTLLDAAREFSDGGFHALPVVKPDGRLVGIVTSTDVMEALVHDLEHAGAARAEQVAPDAMAEGGHAPELRSLRELYRAVRGYLQSGHAEAEHTRLVRATEHARETLRAASVDL
jgi:CBS domain-containing membrane protein